MASEIDYVAEVQTQKLADAIRKVCGNLVGIVSEGAVLPASEPRVVFREVTATPAMIPRALFPGVTYAIALLPKRGEYPLPNGVSEILTESTHLSLGKCVLKKVRSLNNTAEQRIASFHLRGARIEVNFLDGQHFQLNTDRDHQWEDVSVSPDRRYLIVPRVGADRSPDTIPWDAIRKPQSHLDEAQRTKYLLASTLRKLRKDANLTQEQAAVKSGLTRKTITRLEAAGNYPGVGTLEAIAKAYGMTLVDLLGTLRK